MPCARRLLRGVKRVRAPSVTGSGAAAGPAGRSAISPRPRRGRDEAPTTSGVRFPPPPTTPAFRLPSKNAAPSGPPRLRPSRPAPPLAVPHDAPRTPYWPRRLLPRPPSSRPAPSRPAQGKRRGRVTPDLACPSPYPLRNHLTRCPRAGSSISPELAPSGPTPTRPAIGQQDGSCTFLLAGLLVFPVAAGARGQLTASRGSARPRVRLEAGPQRPRREVPPVEPLACVGPTRGVRIRKFPRCGRSRDT